MKPKSSFIPLFEENQVLLAAQICSFYAQSIKLRFIFSAYFWRFFQHYYQQV